jgi:integrase/recombinase XerD
LKLHLPPRPAPQRLPQGLSLDDVERLLTSTRNPTHRAFLMTTYSAGLRVSEVVRLQVTDIESAPERRLIRINQGKGKKDHYPLLSSRLLQALRTYWRLERPSPW